MGEVHSANKRKSKSLSYVTVSVAVETNDPEEINLLQQKTNLKNLELFCANNGKFGPRRVRPNNINAHCSVCNKHLITGTNMLACSKLCCDLCTKCYVQGLVFHAVPTPELTNPIDVLLQCHETMWPKENLIAAKCIICGSRGKRHSIFFGCNKCKCKSGICRKCMLAAAHQNKNTTNATSSTSHV